MTGTVLSLQGFSLTRNDLVVLRSVNVTSSRDAERDSKLPLIVHDVHRTLGDS